MFLSTLYISISRSIDGGRAFSTLEIWSCVFQSREFHQCALVPRFPVPRFQRPRADMARVFLSLRSSDGKNRTALDKIFKECLQ